MNKTATALLILIITATNLTIVESVQAQAIPEFTLKYVDASYNVTFIDPFTGENKTQLIDNRSIVLSVKNQPLPPSENIYYEIRTKGHFEVNWTDLYHYNNNFRGGIKQQSGSDFTIISFVLGDNAIFPIFRVLPSNSQVDFQMETVFGHTITISLNHLDGSPGAGFEEVTAIDTTSGWGNTQTIAIPSVIPSATPSYSPSPSTSPTPKIAPSPTQQPTLEPTMIPSASPMGPYSPIDPYIILIPILIAVVAVIAALVYVKKHKRNPDSP
jgi:hypothetical protein